MSRHLIVGAGGVGRSTAAALTALDPAHEVVLVNRSGTGPDVTGATRMALDATDTEALTRVAADFDVVYNAMNPPYHEWDAQWPPLAAALLRAARGRTLVTMGNLYVFGPDTRTMAEDTPPDAQGHKGRIRARMTEQAMAADAAGELRYTEARASDFFGPGTTGTTSYFTRAILPAARRGKRIVMPMGDVDAPHTWTFVPDVGRTLAALGTDPRALGRIWNVPSNPARSPRQAGADIAAVVGVKAPAASTLPWPVLQLAAPFVPFVKEVRETRHQFMAPYVLDSAVTQRELGITPTPWDEALRESLAADA